MEVYSKSIRRVQLWVETLRSTKTRMPRHHLVPHFASLAPPLSSGPCGIKTSIVALNINVCRTLASFKATQRPEVKELPFNRLPRPLDHSVKPFSSPTRSQPKAVGPCDLSALLLATVKAALSVLSILETR